MRFNELRRTTTFRLTILYGALFALGTIALLWMVYVRSVVYMTGRVDHIIDIQADALLHSPRPGLRQRLIEDLTLNGDRMVVFGLFSSAGERLAGNLPSLPATLHLNQEPTEFPPSTGFPASARLIARALPGGEILVVGRDDDSGHEPLRKGFIPGTVPCRDTRRQGRVGFLAQLLAYPLTSGRLLPSTVAHRAYFCCIFPGNSSR